jgi:DNA-binding response OmpR family regulator
MSTARDVLIVDDDEDMADAVRNVLEREGYECRWAANGLQALEKANTARPGLVLLDMLMPVMNGWECAHKLRAKYGTSLPIVVVTAAEHANTWGEEVGADAVLSKPFEVDDLVHLVNVYVGPAS